jgi:hypothetical protein
MQSGPGVAGGRLLNCQTKQPRRHIRLHCFFPVGGRLLESRSFVRAVLKSLAADLINS